MAQFVMIRPRQYFQRHDCGGDYNRDYVLDVMIGQSWYDGTYLDSGRVGLWFDL